MCGVCVSVCVCVDERKRERGTESVCNRCDCALRAFKDKHLKITFFFFFGGGG